MKAPLSAYLGVEVIAALQAAGYDIVKIGEAPSWMERVWSLPAELYRVIPEED